MFDGIIAAVNKNLIAALNKSIKVIKSYFYFNFGDFFKASPKIFFPIKN